jgi:hypothetical protein
MSETKSTVLVKHHLKQLKLPTMHAECEKTAARAARENLDHLAYLLALCELELVDRERRAAERRLKAAPSLRQARHSRLPRRSMSSTSRRGRASTSRWCWNSPRETGSTSARTC